MINERYRQLSSVAISSKPTAVLDFVLPLSRCASIRAAVAALWLVTWYAFGLACMPLAPTHSVDVNVTPDKRKVLLENEQVILNALQEVGEGYSWTHRIPLFGACNVVVVVGGGAVYVAQGLDALWLPSRYTISRALQSQTGSQSGQRKRSTPGAPVEEDDQPMLTESEQDSDESEEEEEEEEAPGPSNAAASQGG